MKNDYGIEIQSEPLFVQVPLEIYEAEKKELNDLKEKVKELEHKLEIAIDIAVKYCDIIKELEDELQVANRCTEDARERINELEHDNVVLTAINKEKVRIIKELEAVIKENLITEQTDKSED